MRIMLVCALALTGCASIVSTNSRPVTFTSEPTGLPVSVVDDLGVERAAGATPLTVVLPCGGTSWGTPARYYAHCEGKRTEVLGTQNPWMLGNVPLLAFGLIGGAIGGAVDASTGAAWRLPEVVQVGAQ
jgi:hypothetical protein